MVPENGAVALQPDQHILRKPAIVRPGLDDLERFARGVPGVKLVEPLG